ncbi:MoaD/ThiS family protein [Hanstruepera marina]|uniref:MoaD/ThiS family protein n=1 Tax=Hanstruepera marina TaxID=2873265 RepID=UPI001CA76122|nr:MoaD/ThiS family protein [Hanstruepera marina]
MRLNIKYFGLIAELTSCSEEQLEFEGTKVEEVIELLNTKYPDLKSKDFQVAQNREIVSLKSPVTGGDIALLPPFSGG